MIAATYIGPCWTECPHHPSGWSLCHEPDDGGVFRMDYRDAVRIGHPDGEITVGPDLDEGQVRLMVAALLGALDGSCQPA